MAKETLYSLCSYSVIFAALFFIHLFLLTSRSSPYNVYVEFMSWHSVDGPSNPHVSIWSMEWK